MNFNYRKVNLILTKIIEFIGFSFHNLFQKFEMKS